MSERRARFSLREMLIGVAIVALPLSQYPVFRYIPTGWVTYAEPPFDPDMIRLRSEAVSGYYVPTWRFSIAASISGLVALAWYRRRAIRENPGLD